MKLLLIPRPESGCACRGFLTFVLLAALSACSSSQIRVHTLVPPPLASENDSSPDAIAVERVSVPPQLNRTELILRKGDSQLLVLESDWWGAPLPEEIRSALATRLEQTTGSEYRTRVWVSVTRFDAIPGQSVWLDADYRLAGNPDLATSALQCSIRRRSESGNTLDSIVLAHQLNIEALAEDIIMAVRNLNAGNPGCP
ncbi:membrane integrity-associated transporter subunit PqiC [Marinobacter sp.]|uniref:membrane integrity-associated transporter subunit PqiC n=1 Tax=Marinobacter sp. TaxID=50741 RepID=UPI0034A024B0